MPSATNPIAIFFDAIFALLNISLSIVFGYLGTLGMLALGVGALVVVVVGGVALARSTRR